MFVLLLSIWSNLPETTSGETLSTIKMIAFNSSSHVHARLSEYLCQLLRSEVLHVFYFSVVNHLIGLSECLSECQHVVGDHTSDLTIVHIDFNEKKSLYYYQQYNFETPSRLLYVWAVDSLLT